MPKKIEEAYQKSWDAGRIKEGDSIAGPYLAAPMEAIRLPVEQGLFVQHELFLFLRQYDQVVAGFEANKRKCHHLEIRTPRLLVTCHRVLSPEAFPPYALYRLSNARRNELWLPGIKRDDMSGDRAYLFILHGPATNPKDLGFIRIALPNPEIHEYLAYKDIFLHEEFKNARISEEIPDNVTITLKVTKKKEIKQP